MFPKSEVEWLKCMVGGAEGVAVARDPNLRKGEDHSNSPSLLNWGEPKKSVFFTIIRRSQKEKGKHRKHRNI